MKFGPMPLDEAEGKILAHHIASPDGHLAFHKGKPLAAGDIAKLRELGQKCVFAVKLEPGDLDENQAADRVARIVCGENLSLSMTHVGRTNLQAQSLGILHIDKKRLDRINMIEGITLATLLNYSVVRPRQTVATVKVVPFAVPEQSVNQAEHIGQESGPVLSLTPLPSKSVALLLTGSSNARQRVVKSFVSPLQNRVEALGSCMKAPHFVSVDADDLGVSALTDAIQMALGEGTDIILLAGETAIMDIHDLAPMVLAGMGGEITCFGAPVDPGNLLMVAYLGKVPVLGAPGCARSLKPNVIDWILPRLLAGERLTRGDISSLGHGGLLEPHSVTYLPLGDKD
jgi:molybdenum cofactor cytidylyltransferase